MKILLLFLITAFITSAQRITTIQLDGVQYFVSRMNPYSPELNYFLAYQYCRSLGLQLASFETKEKADTMTEYLINAGYKKYEFWTSGNKLGTDMYLWMSTGLPFNSTFDYMHKKSSNRAIDVPPGTEPQRVARESGKSSSAEACVAMVPPSLSWEDRDCLDIKDFICEQTRCYYYNYGSIPVSATQGNRKPYLTTTTTSTTTETATELSSSSSSSSSTTISSSSPTAAAAAASTNLDENAGEHQLEPESQNSNDDDGGGGGGDDNGDNEESVNLENIKNDDASTSNFGNNSEDPVVGRLISTIPFNNVKSTEKNNFKIEKNRNEDIPDITTLFTNSGTRIKNNDNNVFIHHDIHFNQHQNDDYKLRLTKSDNKNNDDSTTIGPYGSAQDYVNDEPESIVDDAPSNQDDASTILPDAEPAYRYNIKVRSNGKVLDPPSN